MLQEDVMSYVHATKESSERGRVSEKEEWGLWEYESHNVHIDPRLRSG